MTALLHLRGPAEPGPGDRAEALHRARRWLGDSGVKPSDVTRIDVPPRGLGEEGSGALRMELEPLVPALQLGSLFGGRQGVEVIDAQHLTSGEASVVADLVVQMDAETVSVVLVSFGSLPPGLVKAVGKVGEVEEVRRLRERDAAVWLAAEVKARDLQVDSELVAAMVQRFGSDVASMEQALDQLSATDQKVTGAVVLDRFRNRPDEPMWHYADAVAAGDVGEALRRLADFLTHGHPLQLLGYLENELRWQAIASSSEDLAAFAAAVGARESDARVAKLWRRRGAAPDSQLARSLEALVKADRVLKTAPEELTRLTMERLTVALCRLLGKRRR